MVLNLTQAVERETCCQSPAASNRLPKRTGTAAIADNRGSEKSNRADPSQIQHRNCGDGSCPATTAAEAGAVSDDQANASRWTGQA